MDADRGYMMRVIDGIGIQVFMYVDEPGVFRNAFGQEVDTALANQAGFDVERLTRERKKREALKAAYAKIEDEMAASEVKQEVVKERNGYEMVDIGLGRFHIKDPEGKLLTTTPVSNEIAERLFDQIAPEVSQDAPEVRTGKKVKESGSASS